MDTTRTLMTKVKLKVNERKLFYILCGGLYWKSALFQVEQVPVCLRKEIDGFALNRIQAAIIAESWRLVQVSAAVASALAK